MEKAIDKRIEKGIDKSIEKSIEKNTCSLVSQDGLCANQTTIKDNKKVIFRSRKNYFPRLRRNCVMWLRSLKQF